MKIVTRHVNPPIPDRGWDWVAFIEDMEGDPQGSGPTESAAVADLREQLYLRGIEGDAS